MLALAQGGVPVMAIAAGDADPGKVGHPQDKYGPELAIVRDLGIGPTMAATVVGETLYTIGRGTLRISDISNPDAPRILGKLGGLGNTRQIAVSEGIAYITAREDGVFIVDVQTPQKPRLLCHYDAIEVATGVDISGSVLFVACRSHGVEIVDVSNPAKPLHLSVARTGEAQSVAVRNGYAYVGVWGSSELVVVDVSNPREPNVTAKRPLDGYGDGVAVRGKHVYVATGHHSRARKVSRPKEGDVGYGAGHGLEIFDISNPAEPAFVSRIKTPPFYSLGNDMWCVKIAGEHAFIADTYNGMFVVSIKDPANPHFVAHRQLAYVESRELPGFVGGLALAKDHIYVAGGWTDLHVLAASGLAKPCSSEPDTPLVIPPFKPRHNDGFRIYRPDGQVRAVAFMGNLAVLAAGSDGIHVVQLWPEIRLLNRYETQGFAMEVKAVGDLVYVAEEKGGLSIWRQAGPGQLALQARYQPRGRIVRDVVIPPPGKYALLQLDLSVLDILDVSTPSEPRSVLTDKGHGFVNDIADELFNDRYACVLWQLHGVFWYDLYGGPKPEFTGKKYPHRLGSTIVVLGDKVLTVHRGGFVLLDPEEQRPPSEMPVHRVPKHRLTGKPQLYGAKLYLSSRTTGDISIVDVSDAENPRLVDQFNIPGNPGRPVLHNGALVVPNGYEGLWVEDTKKGTDTFPDV